MRSWRLSWTVVGLLYVGGLSVALGWTNVGPGIDYQLFQTADPNNVYVARMERDNPQCLVDTMLANNDLGTYETIGSQASRFDDAVSYWNQDWGLRNDVVVAVNGDFLDTVNNVPLKGMIMSGWHMKNIDGGNYRFFFNMDREFDIGYISPSSSVVRFIDSGATSLIYGTNCMRETDELIVYTHHYGSTTPNVTGTEVLVEMTRPALGLPASDPAIGIVREVRQNAGATQIPFDHVVLSGSGGAASWLNSNAHVGDRVGVIPNFSGYPYDAHKTYASIGGDTVFLNNGVVWSDWEVRHPRTAIATNDQYLFFVVCDGRRAGVSVGMTLTELGNFCKDYLGATWGINQDGGGSSTMIVNGTLKNQPSDGSQRAVVNGIFMGTTQPKQQSTTFNSGNTVKTSASATAYLGPGTNFLTAGSVAKNVTGMVLDHHLRGIYAKGFYWWKVDFSGTVGWVKQTSLTLVTAGNLPMFTQHPLAQDFCPGGNVSFTVTATGTGTLSYCWQFNGSDLADNATYSGTNTQTLSVSAAAAGQGGSYRCVATDANGNTTSYSAPLHVKAATTVVQQPVPLIDPPLARGASAVFSTCGVGEGPASYRWHKDGADLSDSAKYTGTAAMTLTVLGLDAYDEGTYSCEIAAGCGVVSTAGAGLRVLTADFNRDGCVDQSDFGHLQACLTGMNNTTTDPNCRDANIDADSIGDIDVDDLADFLQCFTGPGVPRLPGC